MSHRMVEAPQNEQERVVRWRSWISFIRAGCIPFFHNDASVLGSGCDQADGPSATPAGPRTCRPPARHPGDARGAHHPRDTLAADRDAASDQFGVNPRRAVRAPAASMNLLHAGRQLRIGPRASRGWTPTPRVVPARGDTEHTGHHGDTETALVRAHEPIDLPGSGLARAPGRRVHIPFVAQLTDLTAQPTNLFLAHGCRVPTTFLRKPPQPRGTHLSPSRPNVSVRSFGIRLGGPRGGR